MGQFCPSNRVAPVRCSRAERQGDKAHASQPGTGMIFRPPAVALEGFLGSAFTMAAGTFVHLHRCFITSLTTISD